MVRTLFTCSRLNSIVTLSHGLGNIGSEIQFERSEIAVLPCRVLRWKRNLEWGLGLLAIAARQMAGILSYQHQVGPPFQVVLLNRVATPFMTVPLYRKQICLLQSLRPWHLRRCRAAVAGRARRALRPGLREGRG